MPELGTVPIQRMQDRGDGRAYRFRPSKPGKPRHGQKGKASGGDEVEVSEDESEEHQLDIRA